jgi:hypothetical protein
MPKCVQLKSFSNGERASSNDGSRPKAWPQKPDYSLQDSIFMAAEAVGDPDRYGRGGLVGYLKYLAVKHPRTFGMLLAAQMRQSKDSNGPKSRVQTPGLNNEITLETAGEVFAKKLRGMADRMREWRRLKRAKLVVRSRDFTNKRFRNCPASSPGS